MTAARLTIVIDHTYLKGMFIGTIKRRTFNIDDSTTEQLFHALEAVALDHNATPTHSKHDK